MNDIPLQYLVMNDTERVERHQEYLVTSNTNSSESWELIPITLQRYQTTRYRFSSSPANHTLGMIIKEDDRFIADQTLNIRRDELNPFLAPILRNYAVSIPDQEDIIRQVLALAFTMRLPETITVQTTDVLEVNIDDPEEFQVILELYGEEDDDEDIDSNVEEEEEDDEDIDCDDVEDDIDVTDSDEDEDEDETIKMVPATKSSVEKLEKVELDRLGDCSICLEELPIGLKVTCMPCSHVFHSNCIVKWLEKSCLCPLCRFPMPFVD